MNDTTQISEETPIQETPQPSAPVPADKPEVGLSDVIGHYQLATHKDGKVDTLVVVKVVKAHDGTEQILYKTYEHSAIAKKVMEEKVGEASIHENLTTVKLNDKYKAKDGSEATYGISDLLEFQSIGFVLVLFVLAGLWGLIALVSYIVKILGLAKTEAPKSAPAPASAAKTIHPGLTDEQFVAIISAAAAHALGGKPVSVVKFRPLNTMDWTWAIQGRVSLHTHKV